MVLAGIQKKPFAGFRRAGTNIGQLIRCQQIGRGAGDGPEQAVEVSEVVEAPLEAAVLRRRQTHVRGRGLCSGIQSGETSRRSGALVHDRPENIVNGFPQFPCVIERTLGEVGLEVAALVEAEADQIQVSLDQLLGLGGAVVKRVDEVEADVARNQFKARRTPPRNLLGFFGVSQKTLPFYPLPII